MAKTNYLEEALLDHIYNNTPYTSPTTIYIGLFSTATADDGTGTELTGNGYARQSATFGVPAQNVGVAEVSNDAEVLFPEASADWPEATHFASFDAVTGGNMLHHAALDTPRTASTGDQLRFQAGTLTFGEG